MRMTFKRLPSTLIKLNYGIFNVTNFVMRRLQAVNRSPDIKIDPPWIRINIGTPNEN